MTFRVLSSGALLQTSVLRGAGLLRLQVVTCLTALAGGLVVVHGHQEQNFGYYQVSHHEVNRACAHIILNAFLKGKNKCLCLILV